MENPGNNTDSNITSGANESFWISSVPPITFEKLQQNAETDVLVIGGGISGLTTAYCLLKEGLRVILVEDGFIGSGESGRTTAHISFALDDRYSEIAKAFGEENARLAAQSHIAALEWINQTVLLEGIDCDFKRIPGYLFPNEKDRKEILEVEFEATRRAGLNTRIVDHVPGITFEEDNWCIMFPEQGQFHPMKYYRGLADAIVRLGGKIYTETKATDISKKGATANGFEITAKDIVVATNTPVNDLFTMHTKQWPYRTYVIAARVPKGRIPFALWWDTDYQGSKWPSPPYHYVRLQEYDEDYDLLIVGGEDHKTGQADEENLPEEDRYFNLMKWARKRFPSMVNVIHRWSGQVMEPVDYMAFIGKNPGDDNIYIITGDSGNGITHGTIGGILITDLITGHENPWADLYDPSRKPLKEAGTYLREAGNMAKQYADWVSEGDIKEANDLKPGEGGIISSGLKKYAVYRDENNQIHAFSAVCPHMKGIVQWNATEKTFDCPVHGSRFTIEGKVVNGPAESDLRELEIKELAKI
jgi:glycine/D-amino acid oxidase-like deaminating enzyme/nitrite reductase/ring-hydroxylating ferredoxin subunit